VRLVALGDLVVRDLRRSAGTFSVAALGIVAGIGTLAFFLGLGEGMRAVVLGRIFPIDRIEVVPRSASAGAVAANDDAPSTGIDESTVRALRATMGVRAVFPKLRILFPTSGRGGRELIGRDIGTGELVADGIDPALVRGDLPAGTDFSDPLPRASNHPCVRDVDCDEPEMCERPLSREGHPTGEGTCSPPIPIVISPYLVEVFNGAIAPAHRLPPLGDLLLRSAQGIELEWDLGRAGLGLARQGVQRRAHARVAGISRQAIDIGITVPLAVARRLNREFAGDDAADHYTSVIVQLRHPSDTAAVSARVRQLGLEVRTSGAEQMGLLVTLITLILSLTSVIIVVVAALNIAHVFYTLIAERRGELGLMRAVGASRWDVRALVLAEASVVGIASSLLGLVVARLAAWGCDRLAATRLPAFPFKPEHWFVFRAAEMIAVVGFGLGACFLSALAPAWRAARIQPADALAGGV